MVCLGGGGSGVGWVCGFILDSVVVMAVNGFFEDLWLFGFLSRDWREGGMDGRVFLLCCCRIFYLFMVFEL